MGNETGKIGCGSISLVLFRGFEVGGVEEADLTNPEQLAWLKGFRGERFVKFTAGPYFDDELLILAHYADGRSLVCAIARAE